MLRRGTHLLTRARDRIRAAREHDPHGCTTTSPHDDRAPRRRARRWDGPADGRLRGGRPSPRQPRAGRARPRRPARPGGVSGPPAGGQRRRAPPTAAVPRGTRHSRGGRAPGTAGGRCLVVAAHRRPRRALPAALGSRRTWPWSSSRSSSRCCWPRCCNRVRRGAGPPRLAPGPRRAHDARGRARHRLGDHHAGRPAGRHRLRRPRRAGRSGHRAGRDLVVRTFPVTRTQLENAVTSCSRRWSTTRTCWPPARSRPP
jgi:hypothetical protein